MELVKIEAVLERYFEGETTLEEQRQLEAYFQGGQVADHLAPYASMFTGFSGLRAQKAEQAVSLNTKTESNRNIWRYAIAALVVVALSVGFFLNGSGQGLTTEEQQALAAFEKTKEALQMISGNLNDGIEGMAHLNELTEATDQIFK